MSDTTEALSLIALITQATHNSVPIPYVLTEMGDRDNPFANAARGLDECGINLDEVDASEQSA